MDYLDFDLEIGVGRGRKYPLAVVRSPAGEARETMQFPFDELALENHLLTLQNVLLRSGGKRRQILSPDEQAVQDFGRALFEALFTREVRSRYALSQREAVHQGKGLRLKLRIQSPKLAALPWEFLYDTGQAEYVCLSSHTPIVRYLELPQPPQPLSVKLPLRILGMIASPKDLVELDVEHEKQRVETALQHLQAKGMVELTWLPGQTWQELQRSMRRGPWYIFHFIGHGGFDPKTDEGLIALEDDKGRTQHLSATYLGRLLADHRTLRLVVLNSCEGARGSEKDIFSSTAAILVRRGIPAVLAMQYEITDRAAIELSRAFYEALADGMPVDMAVSEARKAISLGVVNTVEWGTPVLYMRSPDGVLFDLIQNPALQEEQPAHGSVPSLLPIPPASLAPTPQAVPDKVVEASAPVVPPSESSAAQGTPAVSTAMGNITANRRLMAAGIILLLILLIGAGIIARLVTINQFVLQEHGAATATSVAQMATSRAIATATRIAANNATATATAEANPYGGLGILALSDPLRDSSRGHWHVGPVGKGGDCEFLGNAYHVSESETPYFNTCYGPTDFSNFAFEVRMTIVKGDCGGLFLRSDETTGKGYRFEVCQDGYYRLALFVDSIGAHAKALTSNLSSVINTGLNASNVIAFVANGSTLDLYVNKQKISSVTDSTYSHGIIGLIALAKNSPTEVIYSNAKVWTLP